jgi:sulfide:quinone oxidoreductase
MSTHVVILGAGFGGLELSSRLAEDLPDDVNVTLIDKSDAFVFGYAKLDVMFGKSNFDDVRLKYRDIAKPNVDFRQEVIESIDPESKRVVTNKATYDADILVVALGADLDPEATPGLLEGGHEYYSPAGANAARDVIMAFDAGTVIVGVLGPFYKCPPAPAETALLLDNLFEKRGVRDAITIKLLSPLPRPIPPSPESSQALLDEFASRGIEWFPETRVARLDPARKVAISPDGREFPYDLFLGVPVHCAPPVAVDAGLTADDGWIAVDAATLETRFENVFAVGDVTSAPVPRAGVFAEGEAKVVADVIVSRLRGGPMPAPYSGSATCYIEFGDDRVGKVDINFLAGPQITAEFSEPSVDLARDKQEFGSSRRARWFGT